MRRFLEGALLWASSSDVVSAPRLALLDGTLPELPERNTRRGREEGGFFEVSFGVQVLYQELFAANAF